MRKVSDRLLFFGLGVISMVLLLVSITIFGNPELVEIGDDYYYDGVDRYMIYPKEDTKTLYSIPEIVRDYDYNDRFIVALQCSRWDLCSRWDYFEADFDSFNFGNHSLEEFKKLFNRDRHGMYFWIIDKETPAIYGPLVQDEFTAVADSLNVPHKMVEKMIDAHQKIKSRK